MQVAIYRATDGQESAVEFVNGVFTVDRFHVTHDQVFLWDERGMLSWSTPETAQWAASLRESRSQAIGAAKAAGTQQAKPRQSIALRVVAVVGAALVLLIAGVIAMAAFLPSAQTAPVEPGVAAIATATPAPGVESGTPADPAPETPADPPAASPAAPAIAVTSATVVRVVDGDTAVFRLASGAQEKVRFIGVDTPESTTQVEVYGKEASAYAARSLAVGTQVFLELDVEQRDRYGRLLAYVWLTKPGAVTDAEIRGKMFNAKLALDGYAQQMTIQPNSKYADYFSTYVAEARFADKGLWDSSLVSAVVPAVAPAVAPAASPSTVGGYVGNRNTMKFHKPACSSVGDMNPANKVALASRSQAISQGYVPCKRCNP